MLSFGLMPTILVFVIVQLIIHFHKISRLEKNEDIKILINALEDKKNNFSKSNLPPVRKKSFRQIQKSSPLLIVQITNILAEKSDLSKIKNECDKLILELNNLL